MPTRRYRCAPSSESVGAEVTAKSVYQRLRCIEVNGNAKREPYKAVKLVVETEGTNEARRGVQGYMIESF